MLTPFFRLRAFAVALCLLPLVALAQVTPPVPTPDNLEAFLGLLMETASRGQWGLVFALALWALVELARKFIPWPVLRTPEGGAVLSLLGSFASGLTLALNGVPFSWAIVWAVLLSTFTSGGRSLLKSLLGRVVPWLLSKIPFVANLFPAKGAVVQVVKAAPVKPTTSDSIANGP